MQETNSSGAMNVAITSALPLPTPSVSVQPVGLSDEQIQGLTRLTMRLYCLPYSDEFRQPVQVKYPDLLDSYTSIIKVPCDLGTVLLKLKNKTYTSIEACAKELKLCFQNAIEFNADLSNLVSISRHLLAFTENLWREILQIPFASPSKKAPIDMQVFSQRLKKNRQIHFEETYQMSLKGDEIEYFQTQLQVLEVDVDSPFFSAVKQILATCDSVLSTHSKEVNAETENNVSNFPSLIDLLSPVIDVIKNQFPCTEVKQQTITTSLEIFSSQHSCFMNTIFPSVDESCYPQSLSFQNNSFLKMFDQGIGEVTAILFERCTRG
jgi:hypothetical protein